MNRTTNSDFSLVDNLIAETKRLKIVRLTIDDADFILQLFKSPGWIRYIGKRDSNSKAAAKLYLINGPLISYETNGWGLYKIILRKSNIAVGICGIVKRVELTNPDLGFAFLPEFEGKGYAFESAHIILQLAKKKFEMNKILAITQKDNIRSIVLLEKLGFVLQHNSTEQIKNDTALYAHSLILL